MTQRSWLPLLAAMLMMEPTGARTYDWIVTANVAAIGVNSAPPPSNWTHAMPQLQARTAEPTIDVMPYPIELRRMPPRSGLTPSVVVAAAPKVRLENTAQLRHMAGLEKPRPDRLEPVITPGIIPPGLRVPPDITSGAAQPAGQPRGFGRSD